MTTYNTGKEPRQLKETRESLLWTGEGVTLGGSLANVALVLVKAVVGISGYSSALVADAVHSLSDLASDIVVLIGFRLGRMPEDEVHPYGHGRVETLCTAVVGGILIAVGCALGGGAVSSLLGSGPLHPPEAVGLWAAAASIVVKELLYRWTRRVAVKAESRLLMSNAWHHRSDALSSVAALIGLAGARWGALWMDSAAALAVCLLVVKVGWDLGWQAIRDLVDTTPGDGLLQRMEASIASVEGVRGHHDLRTRRLGKDILVDVDVEVDPELSVIQGHDVARAVRNALVKSVKNVRDAMVHVEPVGAREGGVFAESGRSDVVAAAEAAARQTGGVLGIHGTRIVPLEQGYLLNLDIEVAPELTVREAHAVAHRLKLAVCRIAGVTDAVIHVDVHGG